MLVITEKDIEEVRNPIDERVYTQVLSQIWEQVVNQTSVQVREQIRNGIYDYNHEKRY